MPDQDEGVAAHPDLRTSTGCLPLDRMLVGGLVPKRPYLVVGPSGTGKTTIGLQFLCEGIRQGERCLLVTLEEPPNEIRTNHRSIGPELDEVFVFDAIPDVMRYERAPFKDIAAVRQSVPFKEVPFGIRKSPELASVEVTFTALEQTLKMEMARRSYTRMVIDSLTALQYFCMKGFDETLGAQTFLRFLSDLHVTTMLTVEAPLEEVESPERLLARGEIRLFRWELDGRTVRAIGVEKFRGSAHDITLHPYRISPKGIDINLDATISRDTRRLQTTSGAPESSAGPEPVEEFATGLSALEQDAADLVAIGVDVGPLRAAVTEGLAAARTGDVVELARAVVRARGRALELAAQLPGPDGGSAEPAPLRRLRARASAARAGIPPFTVPDPEAVRPVLERIQRGWQDAAKVPPPATTLPVPSTPASAPASSPPPVEVPPAPPAPPPAPGPTLPMTSRQSPVVSEPPRPHVPFPPPTPLEFPSVPPPLPTRIPPREPAVSPDPSSTTAAADATLLAAAPEASTPPARERPAPGEGPGNRGATIPPPLPSLQRAEPPAPSALIAPSAVEEVEAPKKRKRAPSGTPRKRAPKATKPATPAGPAVAAPSGQAMDPTSGAAEAGGPTVAAGPGTPPSAASPMDAGAPPAAPKRKRGPRKKADASDPGTGTSPAPVPPPTAPASPVPDPAPATAPDSGG